jgi:hypothetical protein
MALFAKILQEGLAVATAFYVIRIFIILPFARSILAITGQLAGRWDLN